MAELSADGELSAKVGEYKMREQTYMAGTLGQEYEVAQQRAMASDVNAAYGDGSRAALRSSLSSPMVNMEVMILRQRLRERDQQIVNLKEELEANRFDQRSKDGQALMRTCKALLEENRELGGEMREDRPRELRAALVLKRKQNEELATKVKESADFCAQLADDSRGLKGQMASLAASLKSAQRELNDLRTGKAELKKRRKTEQHGQAMIGELKEQIAQHHH
eukprot:CAMPEP_0206444358 /NCGR_PEP_ID=MMETSP0324_2-20121206/14868_1 /ASSEMBLY_ACC=CAM_ASM_000836 /TAXON_ID=2866 /ORGANISM="Crypthecodinium cohnii, Strain Seligo" /LENGTH=221 /DNA_ID=CAMNT_0053912373 /DNA_START=79 /DNA_END=744 /DNA_ORIENTATION=-